MRRHARVGDPGAAARRRIGASGRGGRLRRARRGARVADHRSRRGAARSAPPASARARGVRPGDEPRPAGGDASACATAARAESPRTVRIAFYAPLKAPGQGFAPSGDRRGRRAAHGGAGARRRARRAGLHLPQLRRRRRSPSARRRCARRENASAGRSHRSGATWPRGERPDLWFTYHLYYKAPDWLGPIVARGARHPLRDRRGVVCREARRRPLGARPRIERGGDPAGGAARLPDARRHRGPARAGAAGAHPAPAAVPRPRGLSQRRRGARGDTAPASRASTGSTPACRGSRWWR